MSWKHCLATLVLLSAPPIAESQIRKKPGLEVRFDRQRDLSRYRTYAWHKDQARAENLANHLRIINAVQKGMKEVGFRLDTVEPDALVQYRLELRRSLEASSTQEPSVWDPTDLQVQIDVQRQEEMVLSVELVEAESNFLLWRAKGTFPLTTPDRAARQIQEAVEELYSTYPDSGDEENNNDER